MLSIPEFRHFFDTVQAEIDNEEEEGNFEDVELP